MRPTLDEVAKAPPRLGAGAPDRSRSLHVVADWPVCDSLARPFIREGEYDAACASAHTYPHPRFKRPVIELCFDVFVSDAERVRLSRFYNGATAHSRGSDYFREWTIANQGIAPQRRDRMSGQKFQAKLFRVRVSSVKRDSRQFDLPASLTYSKVSAILELLTTNEGLR